MVFISFTCVSVPSRQHSLRLREFSSPQFLPKSKFRVCKCPASPAVQNVTTYPLPFCHIQNTEVCYTTEGCKRLQEKQSGLSEEIEGRQTLLTALWTLSSKPTHELLGTFHLQIPTTGPWVPTMHMYPHCQLHRSTHEGSKSKPFKTVSTHVQKLAQLCKSGRKHPN